MADFSIKDERVSMNSLDALHLHPSYHSGMMLVSKPFNGEEYGSWRRVMEFALTAKKKLGFVIVLARSQRLILKI